MIYIGKLDKEKMGLYKYKVLNTDVILTEERIKHIKERHLGDYEEYGHFIKDIIQKPNFVLEDTKNIDTIIMLKKIKQKGKNVQLIIKLYTGKDKKRNKNSILSLWKIRNSTYKQLVKNKKILYKDE